MLFSLLYRLSFSMSVSLSFPFLFSSLSDLHNKTCNRLQSVTTLAMKLTAWHRGLWYWGTNSGRGLLPWCLVTKADEVTSKSPLTENGAAKDRCPCLPVHPFHTCKIKLGVAISSHDTPRAKVQLSHTWIYVYTLQAVKITMFRLRRPSAAPASLVVMQNVL